ncbi:MAG TPA: hypothetical protein VMF91_12395 [Bryobacteraceae bacterium]|nr:hypothetical protein [Bryobacteraceae bacterium]
MLYLRLFRAELDSAQAESFAALKTRLGESLNPLLLPAVRTTADLLGVSVDDLRSRREHRLFYEANTPAIDGEIFTDGDSLFILALTSEGRTRLVQRRESFVMQEIPEHRGFRFQLSVVASEWEPSQLASILTEAADVLGVSPEPYWYSSDRLTELRGEVRENLEWPSFSTEEITAAEMLAKRLTRTLALAIKSSGGLLLRDVQKQISGESRETLDEIISTLRERKLVDSEIVVICSKNQAQVSRAPNREILEELSAKGIKCACGRPIGDERTEEALTATESARALLDKTRWLTLLVIEELKRVGIPAGNILVEQSIGGDEVDCIANISGELALFELKDKEFNLGNAYSFGAKIGIVQPSYPVIITSEKVGNDVREHFVRARPSRRGIRAEEPMEITYIEGMENLRKGIETLVSRIYRKDAESLLDRVLPVAAIDSHRLLEALERDRTRLSLRSASAV